MFKCLAKRLAQGVAALTDDALAAAQLETFIIASTVSTSERAWKRARIQSRDAWLRESWEQHGDDTLLLTSGQARALWMRVIKDVEGGASVIHTSGLASAAQHAWQLLCDWNLDAVAQRARPDEPSFAAFLRWSDRYHSSLRTAGWIDTPLLTARMRAAVENDGVKVEDVLVADSRTQLPAFDRLLASLAGAGSNVAIWQPENVSRRVGTIALGDRREEIDAALSWACDRLTRRPSERVAIVIADEPGVEAAVRRWFACDESTAEKAGVVRLPTFAEGTSAGLEPLLGAALDGLTLLGASSDFSTLSRVLRCPYFADDGEERGRRAVVEGELRGVLAAQADFPSAFRYGGLARRLRAAIPSFTDRLASVLGQLEALPRVQSATQWARYMDEALRRLGWHGAGDRAPGPALEVWSRATTEYCGLTPIVGGLTYERAVDELQAILRRTRRPIELPVTGISIFSNIVQVGPGYDAAWSTGMSDRAWPCAARPNSLLPLALQRSQGMPFASPAATLSRCREQMADFIARIPDVVFSYPETVDDEPARPSSLIETFDRIEVSSRHRLAYQDFAKPGPCGAIEAIDDPVPPMTESVLPGGARTLALQAECPLRAFIEGRLRARSLDRPERGVGARLRGILAHRALELIYEVANSTTAVLELRDGDGLGELIGACTNRTLQGHLSVAGRSQRALRELERARLEALVTTMVHKDLERSEFVVEALELRKDVELSGVRIRCRIDRVDRLPDGRLAIIDYKTGRNVKTRGLLTARLSEPQLPLYSLAFEETPGALVYAVLRPGAVAYRGCWDPADAFPGRPLKLNAGCDWASQRALWREQLTTLVDELVAGDGRVFPTAVESLRDEYASLSRACEIESDAIGVISGDDA